MFSFPSPNSSHTSSPTHASDISNSPPNSVFSDDEENIDNITPTLPGLDEQPYQNNDFSLVNNNEFGNSCTNASLVYHPTGNGSDVNLLLNFVERSLGIEYGGGVSGAGMYQGMPSSGVTSTAVNNLDQNSDGKSVISNCFQMSGKQRTRLVAVP